MLFSAREHLTSHWLDLAEGRLRLDRLNRNGGGETFFPWANAHSSRGKKVSPPPSSAALRPKRVRRRSPSALRSPSRPRWSRSSKTARRSDMANIGSFKKSGQEFQGEIVTLSLQTKGVRIVPRQTAPTTTLRATGLRRPRRGGGRMVEALYGGPRLSLDQAGRSEPQRSDLRQPLRRRRRRDLHANLVRSRKSNGD